MNLTKTTMMTKWQKGREGKERIKSSVLLFLKQITARRWRKQNKPSVLELLVIWPNRQMMVVVEMNSLMHLLTS
jgi:hypothetical protein